MPSYLTFNPHVPGPIGDTTPSTIAGTSITGTLSVAATGAGANVFCGNDGSFVLTNRGGIYCPSNGVIRLTNTTNDDFSLLCFGGTSASFPAIKRTAAKVTIRLADDSANAGFVCSVINVSNMPTSSSGLTSGDLWSNSGVVTRVP